MTDTVHIRNARLIDPEAGTDAPGSLTIADGTIAAVNSPAPRSARVIDGAGLCLAPGIVDWGVKVGEPGERHKESFRSAGAAAAAGGVTTIVTRPDTHPPIDTPEALEFVARRAREASLVRVVPQAALTRSREGREMVEMAFRMDAGAAAFTDGTPGTRNTRVLSRCLTYARSLTALVVTHPQDPGLSDGAAATRG